MSLQRFAAIGFDRFDVRIVATPPPPHLHPHCRTGRATRGHVGAYDGVYWGLLIIMYNFYFMSV